MTFAQSVDVFNKMLSHPLFVCRTTLALARYQSTPISRSASVQARYLHSTFALAQSRFEFVEPRRGMCSTYQEEVPAVP